MGYYTCEVHKCKHAFEAEKDWRHFGDVEAPVVNCPKCNNVIQVGEGRYWGPPTIAEMRKYDDY